MTGWGVVFCEGCLLTIYSMVFVSLDVGGRTTTTGKAPNR